jgi:hypothetical protein
MSAWNSQGLKISHKIGAATDFTELAGVGDSVNLDPGKRAQIDVTGITHLNPKKLPGMKGDGTFAYPIFWDPADTGHQALYAAYNAGTLVHWKITCSDTGAGEITFDGYILEHPWSFGKDKAAEANLSIVLDGGVTVTP